MEYLKSICQGVIISNLDDTTRQTEANKSKAAFIWLCNITKYLLGSTSWVDLFIMSRVEGLISVLRIHRQHQQPSALADELVNRLVEAVHRASLWSYVIIVVSAAIISSDLMSQVAQVLPIQYDAADVPLGQIISGKTELNAGHFGKGRSVELLPVQPWNFTLPLNASVIRAQKLGASKIVFLSLEMTVLNDELNQILSLWSRGVWHKSYFLK